MRELMVTKVWQFVVAFSLSAFAASESAIAATCPPLVTCDAPPLKHTNRKWRHPIQGALAADLGKPRHRGRDLKLTPTEDQFVVAKFAYGIADKDLEGEEVDIYLQTNCTTWDKLGTGTTLRDGRHKNWDKHDDIYENVKARAGILNFKIPDSKRLGIGRHRVRLVVAGDGTFTDMYLDIVPPGTQVFVTDIDGTLTTSESVEFIKLLEGKVAGAHPSSANAMRILASKGYRPFYMSARPSWLTPRSREFVAERNFPQGMVHSSPVETGLLGKAAADYKLAELEFLTKRGFIIAYAFGNQPSDSEAYATLKIPKQNRIFYQIKGDYVGRSINSYAELITEFNALPNVCQ